MASEPCEDCGHDPCDCDMYRWAHEQLYGDEHDLGCTCYDCLQRHGYGRVEAPTEQEASE
jgi:hypothetical protein